MGSALALSLLLSWVQVSSNTFVVKSSAGEEAAERVLQELESFHQLVGTFVFRRTELPDLRVEVLLIGDEQTLKELAPEYQGRRITVDGFYQRGPDRDFIVLSGRVSSKALTTIAYHELTHYFMSRALMDPPTWLSEGLAEYFASAVIRDNEMTVGAVERAPLQILKSGRYIPFKDFLAVNAGSPYYNEPRKATVFYAQSWAFVHFMMHGEYAPRFRQYLEELSQDNVDFVEFMGVSERTLENSFNNYWRIIIPHLHALPRKLDEHSWSMRVKPISDDEAQVSIAEIFLAAGRLKDAERYLKKIDLNNQDFPRASYYQGILAQIAGDNSAARDLFVDALADPELGYRAAVQLVRLGESQIPAVRELLKQAAAARTRMADVYWALSEIYMNDVRRIQESVRVARKEASLPLPVPPDAPPEPAPDVWHEYAQGMGRNFSYRLLSNSALEPHLEMAVAPYYPQELAERKLSGEVVMDLQITEEGDVGGVWLVESTPEVFSTLATAGVRQWRFEMIPAKLRVVLKFMP